MAKKTSPAKSSAEKPSPTVPAKEQAPVASKNLGTAGTPVKVRVADAVKKSSTPKPAPTPAAFSWKQLLRWPYLVGGGAALLIIIVGIALALGGGTSSDTLTNTQVTANTNTDVPFAPDLMGGNRYLHGHYYPVAVMIDNHSAARPQSGLQAASVVYEALVEGGITRFMAVFDYQDVAQIGPVRSARPYFLQWLAEYDAAYAHAGGSPEALGELRKDRIHDINGIGNAAGAFRRDKTRPAPHNLYTSQQALYGITKASKLEYGNATITPWTFGPTLAAGGIPAKSVDMFFTGKAKSTQVTYAYDAAKLQWLRSQAGVAHQDRLTKTQIGVTNLIVQRISSSIAVGEKGRLSLTVTGTGAAKLFQQGTVRDVTWTKATKEARTVFTNADGSPVTFLPGNTWVEVLPSDRTLSVQ
ncbi:MAG: DUF3048 domain-containing protein [Patescibacteria group bacterium]